MARRSGTLRESLGGLAMPEYINHTKPKQLTKYKKFSKLSGSQYMLNTNVVRSVVLITTLFCFSSSYAAQTIKVAWGSSWVSRLKEIAPEAEKQLDLKINFLTDAGVPAESAYASVDTGVADVAFLGSGCDELLELVAERKYEVKSKDIKCKNVASSEIYFVTAPGGPTKLSQEQVTGLFTGKIKNWKEVGGQDLPVKIALQPHLHVNMKQIKDKYFGGAEFDKASATMFKNFDEQNAFVEKTPGAVAFVHGNMKLGNMNHPKHPIMVRNLCMVTRGDASSALVKLAEKAAPNGKLK